MHNKVNLFWDTHVNSSDIEKGKAWYPKAFDFIKKLSDDCLYSRIALAGVIAITSPRVKWTKQLETLPEIVKLHDSKEYNAILKFGLNGNFRKAIRILDGELPSVLITGRKVSNFYQNLIGNLYAVTLDVWMWRIVGYNKPPSQVYIWDAYESSIRNIAADTEMKPAEVQAAIWIAARRKGQLELEV